MRSGPCFFDRGKGEVMNAGLERRVFNIGEPVVVVTPRPIGGWVMGVDDIPHVGVVDLAPQNL